MDYDYSGVEVKGLDYSVTVLIIRQEKLFRLEKYLVEMMNYDMRFMCQISMLELEVIYLHQQAI